MRDSHFVLRTAWLCAAMLAATVSVAGATPINVQFYTEGVFYLDGGRSGHGHQLPSTDSGPRSRCDDFVCRGRHLWTIRYP